MSDASVRLALRSDNKLVVVEAPAGCGKTHQGADYANEIVSSLRDRLLILTHTHAACAVFADRTRGAGTKVEIRTIDGLISQIAGAYHVGLDLPPDPAVWARRTKDGYAQVAARVATFLERHPMVSASLAHRYPTVLCDEHQDCSGDQHAISMALQRGGAKLRVFADPMQGIYKKDAVPGGRIPSTWESFTNSADAFEELDTPHRWRDGCNELGAWTLDARRVLKRGGQLELRSNLPPSVAVVFAENEAQRYGDYRVTSADRSAIDAFVKMDGSLLVLSHHKQTAQNLRAFFRRRLPLWEGHTRPALERLVSDTATHEGKPEALAESLVNFMGSVGKGFSRSAFGDRLVSEAAEGCIRSTKGKPRTIQQLARHIVDAPNHLGVSRALKNLDDLCRTDPNFSDVELDCTAEFWEAVRLGSHTCVEQGLAHITHQRTHARPKPPAKAISTIHKAKGLECDSVLLLPCDRDTFPDTLEARCLLYVALSRAKRRLQIVVSRAAPSPLLRV